MIIEFGKHKIELYDNPQNLPILRFQKFNKYMMMANEIGNTFADYDQRTAKALQFLQKNMVGEAIQELNNRRQLVFNAFNEYSPSGNAFATLVKAIDGKRYDGNSSDEIQEVLRHLNQIGIPNDVSMEKLIELKKKIESELTIYFPSYFPKVGNPNHAALRMKRVHRMLDGIIQRQMDSMRDEVFDIEKDILHYERPNVWNVHKQNNMERAMEVDFQKFGVAVCELTGQDINRLSTFTFYASVEHLKEKHKVQK